jgi:PST family polysaccharide transporter
LVNEQAEVGLLLAAPGILGTLTFASLVLSLFYSAKFAPAVEILRWQILGMFLRVTSWPMVFILIAKGKGKLYFAMEVLAQSLHIGLIWLGIAWWGLRGVGMAFVVYNLFYWCVTFVVVRKLTGFAWSPANRRFAMAIAAPVLVAFLAPYFLIRVWAMVAGAAATLLIGLFSFKALHAITGSRNVLASLANVLGLGTKRM